MNTSIGQENLLNKTMDSSLSESERANLPYVLFSVGENVYAIGSEHVISIELAKDVTTVVGSPSHVKGGIIFDGNFINIVDMRKLFGLDTQIEEFTKMVNPEQRMKEHENWMTALEKSVQDRTKFTLTDDPHQCEFGRWFYSFKSDNHALNHQLNKIEKPHTGVHEAAKVVEKLMAEDKQEEAFAVIDHLRSTHYKTTMRMLSDLRDTVSANLKELFIILKGTEGVIGISVDSIVGIESLKESLTPPPSDADTKYVKFISRSKTSKSPVLVLDSTVIR